MLTRDNRARRNPGITARGGGRSSLDGGREVDTAVPRRSKPLVGHKLGNYGFPELCRPWVGMKNFSWLSFPKEAVL